MIIFAYLQQKLVFLEINFCELENQTKIKIKIGPWKFTKLKKLIISLRIKETNITNEIEKEIFIFEIVCYITPLFTSIITIFSFR